MKLIKAEYTKPVMTQLSVNMTAGVPKGTGGNESNGSGGGASKDATILVS